MMFLLKVDFPENKIQYFFRHVKMENLTWKAFGNIMEVVKNDLEFFQVDYRRIKMLRSNA